MNTSQAATILHRMFDAFYRVYAENHPGCNGNDIERAFLVEVGARMIECGVFSEGTYETVYRPLINKIA